MKNRFLELFNEIDRENKEQLLEYLEQKEFFTAPASSGNHLSTDGGLLEHSLNVCEIALKIADTLDYENRESVILVALFHDLGKAAYYNKPQYLPSFNKDGSRSKKAFEKNKERTSMPHEMASLHILAKLIQLTEEESFAIYFHNGMYVGSSRELKNNERPLQMILHFADMWASRCIEQSITEYEMLF